MHRVLDSQRNKQVEANLCALAIMTKAPRAGTVKTRLQPPLTAEEAAQLNICFLRDIVAAIAQACSSCSGGLQPPTLERSLALGAHRAPPQKTIARGVVA